MEEIEEYIQNTESKISKLNDFIALSLRRKCISKELDQLAEEVIKARDLMTEAHKLMQQELNNSKYEYEEIMSQMRKKQLMIIGYTIKEKQKEAEEEKKLVRSCGKPTLAALVKFPRSGVKNLSNNLTKLHLGQSSCLTPTIKISEYKESPLVKRKICHVPFQFEEFDVVITQQQFDSIPKYMCGRETLDQLNSFLETVIIPCFNEKYKLIHKDRSCLKNVNDLELWKLYNDQASLLPGRTFITPGDLTRKLNKMLDKKTQNRLIMIRHIGIISEVRVKQTICYVWAHTGH